MQTMQLNVKVGEPQQVGALTLYPLWNLNPPAFPYLPGPLAPQPEVEINEVEDGGQVDTVEMANAANLPLLLVEGELIVGAQQDRTLNLSLLLPVGERVRVPVSCVEAGRWGGGRSFSRSHRMASPTLRWSKADGVNRNLQDSGRPHSDQGGVWQAVDGYIDRFAGASRPMTAAFTEVEDRLRSMVDLVVLDTRPETGQCGVAAAVGGRIVALDLFDRPETLEAYWDGIVGSYALEALDASVPGETPSGQESRNASSRDGAAVEELLAELATLVPSAASQIGLGEGFHFESGSLRAAALAWEGSLVHLGVLVRA